MPFLLSLPPSLVETFHSLTGKDAGEWFCAADPVGKRLGSGGGTVWLMREAQSPEVQSLEAPSNSPSRGELWRQSSLPFGEGWGEAPLTDWCRPER